MKKNFCNITFELLGNDKIVDLLSQEFSLLPETTMNPEITFQFEKAYTKMLCPKSMENYHRVNNILFNESNFYIHDYSFNYHVAIDSLFHNSVKIESIPNFRQKIPDSLCRFLHWNYMTPIENATKNFIYGVFDYLMYLQFLKHNSAFIHASSVMKNGRVLLLPGVGGVGKTSLLVYLIYKDNWKFLADDFSVITKDGTVHLNPKYMQIYPYNFVKTPELQQIFMENRSCFDRLNWELYKTGHGLKGVRRRVSPYSLFGEKSIGNVGKIWKVIFLISYSGKEIVFKKITSEEIAKRCANIIIKELNPLENYSETMYSISHKSPLPTIQSVFKKSERIYLEFFKKAHCYSLYIPKNVNYKDLLVYLKQ